MVAHNSVPSSSPTPVGARVMDAPDRRVRWSAAAAVGGGFLGAICSTLLIIVPPAVEPGVYNYPLTGSSFVVVQLIFVVVHLLLAFGLMGVWWARVVPPSAFGSAGALAAAGSLVLLAIVHLVSIAAVNFEDSAVLVQILNASFGVVTAASGLSLILAGISVVVGKAWPGPGAYLPLILGIYVFGVLIPALQGPWVVARLAITGWCALFVALGIALRRRATLRPRPVPGEGGQEAPLESRPRRAAGLPQSPPP